MADTFRALCADLADAYLRTLEHINNSTWLGYEPSDDPLLLRARAALADEPAAPTPPADGEVAGLVADLQQQANHGFSDLTRNLLISLASHMAYMQGQLQARHDPDEDDLEDCYWYAESVALRQMVSDVLAGEPAAVTGQPRPMDEDWDALVNRLWSKYETIGYQGERFMYEGDFCTALDLVRQEIAHWGNPAPAPPADVSQLSDGYHTFAELYEHRHSLMLALMRALPRICWFSRRHADGELPFGSDDWFIVGAELPGAPITYHLPAALYSLAQKTGALELPAGRPWDGHSAADVVHRLRDWAIEPAPPADGEVAEFAAWLRETGDTIQPSHLAEHQRYKRAAELLQRQAPQPPADGEVAELVAKLRRLAPQNPLGTADPTITRAADLLERQALVPVPVSERLPGPEDMTDDGEVWIEDPGHEYPLADAGDYDWDPHKWILRPIGKFDAQNGLRWLPAHALPLPEVDE